MKKYWPKIKEFILELISPQFCLNCDRLSNFLCEDCYHGLEFYWAGPEFGTGFHFDQLLVMAKYQPPLSYLLKRMKYQRAQNIAPFLGKMLYQHLEIPEADYLTYIPLHRMKLRQRGFNQAKEVALELNKLTGLKEVNLLERKHYSKAQAGVSSREERFSRVRGVFQIRKQYQGLIKGKTIVILDDILTTGATINEAARVLKEAGAREIIALIIASKKD